MNGKNLTYRMSFSLFSFNPESIKKESIKYFEKRSTEMYILRYRCPNDDVFDPLSHLSSIKQGFVSTNNETLLESESNKNDIAENAIAEDLLSLAITDPDKKEKTKQNQANLKRSNSNKQSQNSKNQQISKTNSSIPRRVHALFDELNQNDVYLINNSNDILKTIFRNIKERNYTNAFDNINKSINMHSQYEVTNYQPFNKNKKDLSSNILFTAMIGLLLSYAVRDEEKQYEYFDIISDYPMDYSDLPHFYHLLDEILVTNNGIKQLTLAHLLGFPTQFFIPINAYNQNKTSYKSKRIRGNRLRSGISKNDAIFNHIINKKFRLNRSDHDYDIDSFNDDYSDNDYDYYYFESDDDIDFDDDNFESYDDFDYDFIKNKHFHGRHRFSLNGIDKRSLSEMPPDIRKEFFDKTFKLHEKKKLLDMKIKKRMLKEDLKAKKSIESSNNNDVNDKKGTTSIQNNNNNNNNINNFDNDDYSQWKVAGNNASDTRNTNNSLFEKCTVDEIQVAPILNVVFREDPKHPSNTRINQYYAYKASNGSQIVNCNFIPDNKYSQYYGFNDKEYNYCCLPHFTQSYISKHYLNENSKPFSAISNEYIGKKDYQFYSKYIKMTEAKETIKSISDYSSLKMPLPILTCSIQPEDEKDESLADEIESAITKPSLFLPSKSKSKSKIFLKSSQEKLDDFIDNFDSSCNILKSFKSNGSQKSIKITTKSDPGSGFHPSFGSDDDDFDDDDSNFAIFNNMFNKDIVLKSQPHEAFSILSQINPFISSLKGEKGSNSENGSVSVKKTYTIRNPVTQTTKEIQTMDDGTTITKITTTSNMTFQDGKYFKSDDPPSRLSKDKKKKHRRDGK